MTMYIVFIMFILNDRFCDSRGQLNIYISVHEI